MREQLLRAGTPLSQVDRMLPERHIYVWPENASIVMVFARCRTQWNIAPMSGKPTGLNYAALESVIRMMNLTAEQSDIFWGVAEMESHTLKLIYR